MHAPVIQRVSALDLSQTPWRRILLSDRRNIWCLVDAADYDWLIATQWNWGWHCNTPWKFYAKRNIGSARSTVYMHREILFKVEPGADPAMHGDHMNGQSLDNRRANLRWLTPVENRRHKVKRELIPSLDAIVADLLQASESDGASEPPF